MSGNTRCSCEGWKDSIEKVDGAIVMSTIHGAPYTGRIFEFCPWCGCRLKPEKKPEEYHGKSNCPLLPEEKVFNYGRGDVHWMKRGNDLVCEGCGSWNPEEFVNWLLGPHVDGEFLDPSDSGRKIYVHRPGVANASEGAIKVYMAHLTPEQRALACEWKDKLRWKP